MFHYIYIISSAPPRLFRYRAFHFWMCTCREEFWPFLLGGHTQALKKHARKLPQKREKCASLLTAGSGIPYPKSTQNDRNRVKVGSWDPRGEARGTVWAQSGKKVEKRWHSHEKSTPFLRHFSYFLLKSGHRFFACFLAPSKTALCPILEPKRLSKGGKKVLFLVDY